MEGGLSWTFRRLGIVGCAALGAACPAPEGATPSAPLPSEAVPLAALPTSDVIAASVPGCVPGRGTDYPVGPGQKYATPGDVPFERLGAGDTVRIHYRSEPYRDKLMVGGSGQPGAPIKVCGVADPSGHLPIIEGAGAITRPTLDFPYDGHQPRGLIIVGKKHSDPWLAQPRFIEISGLEIRGATPAATFTDKAGKEQRYSEIATGLFVQRGSHVIIRGNHIHDNGNGLFIGGGGGDELSEDILVEGNWIHDNGSPDRFYEHNVYNEASGVVYQFNRFGAPKSGPQGVLGGNLKERSAGVVIRFNLIEGGAHLIDLVETQEARDRLLSLPSYRESWVYGNVLVRGPANGSMVHYGGDSGDVPTYRRGTLHFVHNSVFIDNADHPAYAGTAIFELSTNEEHLDARSNIFWSREAPRPADRPVVLLGGRDGVVSGVATLEGNWVQRGIAAFDGIPGKQPKLVATMSGLEASERGDASPFVDALKGNFTPSAAVKAGAAAPRYPAELLPLFEYVEQGRGRKRMEGSLAWPGAFGRAP